MKYRDLGPIKNVSRLALGGGGIGRCGDRPIATKLWQPSRQQWRAASISLIWHPCTVTVRRSELLVPLYPDGYPDEIKVTTKCMLGDAPAEEIDDRLRRSLDQSWKASQSRLRRRIHSPWLRNGRWLGGCRSSQSVAPSRSASYQVSVSAVVPISTPKKKGGLEPRVLLQR